MNEDTYKGESLQKKHARYLTHVLNREWLIGLGQEASFGRGLHAFLASREGGDIGVLRSLGVPFDNMVGVDRSRSALEALAARAPSECHLIHGEVDLEIDGICRCLQSVRNPAAKIDGEWKCPARERGGDCWIENWATAGKTPWLMTTFLDFCGHIDKEIVQAIRWTWMAMSVGTVLSIAVLKGREKAQQSLRVAMPPTKNRAARRRERAILGEATAMLTAMQQGSVPWDARAVISAFESKVGGKQPGLARWLLLFDVLAAADPWRLSVPEPVSIIEYQSRTDSSRGVPMLVVSFRKAPVAERGRRTEGLRHLILTERDSFLWRNKVLSERSSAAAADILNVPPATAAAWKAHLSRGTYEAA